MKPIFIKLAVASAAIVMSLWLLEPTASEQLQQDQSLASPSVSAVKLEPGAKRIDINVKGLVQSRWPLQLTAQVQGRLSDSVVSVLPGSLVKKGQVLATVNEREYLASLAQAQANVAAAKLELARTLNEQSVASQLEKSSTENEYRTFKPHVAAARASLKAANAALNAAQQQLDNTRIVAPFNAVVLDKHIAPSKHIQVGDVIYRLASSDALDIVVSLSDRQWHKLEVNSQTTAQVVNSAGEKFSAAVRYVAPRLNDQTRQRQVVLTIEQPYQTASNLLPQQQVEVVFTSAEIKNAVLAPASVLSRDHSVWSIANNQLHLEQVNVIDETQDTVLLQFENEPTRSRQIVLYPLSTMLAGQEVEVNLELARAGE